ncbi:MAG: UDP-N-acetylmuramoyl-L-alanyl-D-glutamate--2,6-diaminopimelate ligase [Alphaproteobacteria bacterium]
MMSLAALAGTGCPETHEDLMIEGLSADSRALKPGYLFAALPGTKVDGADFLDKAVAAGAVAALGAPGARERATDLGLAFVADEKPHRALAHMAARFYAPQPELAVAVTGTNGKSSTVEFVRQIWAHLGVKGAALGTLGLKMSDGAAIDFGHTTPDPVGLHKALQRAAKNGVTALALEASSHGLDQFRMDGVKVAAAGFTNLGRDHLDYHPDLGAYRIAKLGLFDRVMDEGGTAIVDAGLDHETQTALQEIAKERRLKLLTIGGDYALGDVVPHGQGIRAALEFAGDRYEVDLPLIGGFQLRNAIMAVALVHQTGGDLAGAVAALSHLKGVAGRMEQVARAKSGAPILVDYAHTPDALETVLKALRPHVAGSLCVVFGCGGDHDKGKRPLMGEIAHRLADLVIVTDDNPRTEDAALIRQEILQASPDAHEIADRAQAIEAAIAQAGAGDVVLLAGKGHESGQIIGDKVLPFSDADVARGAV